MTRRRWPVAPLEEALRRRLGPAPDADGDWMVGYSSRNAAAVLGVNERTWLRHKAAGDVAEAVADRYACAMALNPWEVWPEWVDRYLDELAEDLEAEPQLFAAS